MNLQQAKELLGINQDDEREIKRKYHNSLVKPESTDGKGQRIYHFKAFLAAPPQRAHGLPTCSQENIFTQEHSTAIRFSS